MSASALLASATLNESERRALDRFTTLLEQELASDLRAVWLYGSRARGDRSGPDSDIDVLVLASGGGSKSKLSDRVSDLARQAEEAEGVRPWSLSVITQTPAWLAGRRAIEAFFIQEVDQDGIVLYGDVDAGGEIPDSQPLTGDGRMRVRTKESLDSAREHLRAANAAMAAEATSVAASPGYYAMLEAARAALSEENLFARTHEGTWHLFYETFVETDRFDRDLYKAGSDGQKLRIAVDYKAGTVEEAESARLIRDAERFIEAVTEMVGGATAD